MSGTGKSDEERQPMKTWQKIIVVAAPMWIIPVIYGLVALCKWLEG